VYDSNTARFLSEDRLGYADDLNLFRPVRNDPVNNTDPSGAAVLVSSCNRQGDGYSWPADILRDDLFYAFGGWSTRENVRFPSRRGWSPGPSFMQGAGLGGAIIGRQMFGLRPGLAAARVGSQGSSSASAPYYKVDLFDFLPPETWEKLRDALKTGTGSWQGLLAAYIDEALSSRDYAIRPNRGTNFFGDPNRGFLTWTEVQKSDAVRLVAILDEAGRSFFEFGDRIIEGATAVAQVALAAVLNQLGIPAAEFFALVERVQGLLGAVAREPKRSLSALLEGFKGGLDKFAKDLPDNLQEIALGWVLEKVKAADDALRLPNLPDPVNVEGLVFWLLDWAGLTWDKLRERLVQALSKKFGNGEAILAAVEKLPGKGQEIFATLERLKDDPKAAIFALLAEARGRIQQELDGAAELFSTEQLYNRLLKEGGEALATGLVQAVLPKLILALFPAGALGNAVLGVYKAIKYVVDNKDKLLKLLSTLLGAAEEVALGDPAAVAARVVELLRGLTLEALKALSNVVGLETIPDAIGKIISGIRDWIGGKIDLVFNWALGLFATLGLTVPARHSDLPYRLVQIKKDGPGYGYARNAYAVRKGSAGSRKCRNYICNFGSLQYKTDKDAKPTLVPSTKAQVVFGTTDEHAEYQLLDPTATTPAAANLPNILKGRHIDMNSVIIVEIFSERKPCPKCESILVMQLPMYSREEGKPTLYYIVDSGPKSDQELGAVYTTWFKGG